MSVSNGVIRQRETVETVSAARVLTSADSGLTLILNAAAGVEIELPAIESGLNFKIIVGAVFATTDWTIASADDDISGGSIVNSVFVPASLENTVTFVASAETVGDYVDITCDGTAYFVNGVGALAGSITFTA
tara:strand:- start:439 stop:837 length:399 start_codon:yes stop_codon:yes gene_type:complete